MIRRMNEELKQTGKRSGTVRYGSAALVACVVMGMAGLVQGFQKPARESLPNYDKRVDSAPPVSVQQESAAAALRGRLDGLQVEFDPVVGSPRYISAGAMLLTGPNGAGRTVSAASAGSFSNDPHGPTKAFLNEHRNLFGFGAEILDRAEVRQDHVGPNNGMRTMMWGQRVNGLEVFEALLISHTTKNGELVTINSTMLANPDAAAAAWNGTRRVTAAQAVSLAAANLGETVAAAEIKAEGEVDPGQSQSLVAPGLNGAEAREVWLPVGPGTVRLGWDVTITSRVRGEAYRLI